MEEKKIRIVSIVVVSLLIVAALTVWYINVQRPYIIAEKEYKAIVSVIEAQNNELDSAISKLQTLVDLNEKPLNADTLETSKDVLEKAVASKLVIEGMPDRAEDIIKKTNELRTQPNYADILKELDDTYTALDTSIKQYKQLTNPSEEFIIQRLKTVDEIVDIKPVTEDNDPNGMLHKAGGYTSTVYFESKNVNQSNVYGTDLIDKGTEAGGAIEVYENEENANKRNEYLATFDGTLFRSGSHKVAGTVIIRTSDELTATQQKALEEKVLNALSSLQ